MMTCFFHQVMVGRLYLCYLVQYSFLSTTLCAINALAAVAVLLLVLYKLALHTLLQHAGYDERLAQDDPLTFAKAGVEDDLQELPCPRRVFFQNIPQRRPRCKRLTLKFQIVKCRGDKCLWPPWSCGERRLGNRYQTKGKYLSCAHAPPKWCLLKQPSHFRCRDFADRYTMYFTTRDYRALLVSFNEPRTLGATTRI